VKTIRIIPRLDVKGPNIVKGIHMEGLRVVGNPVEMARKYASEGADELIAMDIVASLYGRNPDFELMRRIADELFIPLTMGGGIQSLHDIHHFLRAGADKVAINTFALRNPPLLDQAVREFGAQCIVLSVEAKRSGTGWEAYTDGGREHSGRDVITWIHEALERGIGEILLTSIDHDGTMKGYDLDLIRAVADIGRVPVIVHGGASDTPSLTAALDLGVDALAAGSIFHYNKVTLGKMKTSLTSLGYSIRHSM
jgi:cyclase